MENKVTNSLEVAVPKNGVVDEGDGVVSFPGGLTITDGSPQRNGTTYDIESLDVSRYGNQLTGDHEDKLGSLIGEVIGVVKKDGRVYVNKIRYAIKENPYARLAYNLLVGGFSKNFSTETIGPKPDPHTGTYWNSELVGLSQVVTQNNYNAHVNKYSEVVHNSLEQAKQDGLDVTGIEEKVLSKNHVEDEHKMEEDKNKTQEDLVVTETAEKVEPETNESQNEEVTESKTEVEEVKSENDVEDEKVEAPKSEEAPKPIDSDEESEEDSAEAEKKIETPHLPERDEKQKNESESEESSRIEKEVEAKDERAQEVTTELSEKEDTEDKDENKNNNNKEDKMEDKKTENSATFTLEQVQEVVANALKPLNDELASVREEAKNAFDASAKEPEFKKEEKAENNFKDMNYRDRHNKHVAIAWQAVETNSVAAQETLREINKVNLEALKEADLASNAITLETLGNFVLPPEMYREIVGHRNNYSELLNATEWQETDTQEFAWAKRVGDIDMKPVALNATESDADANLKPISEYGVEVLKSPLEELAAVTVVATSATRFFAADLLADAARGYRNDYDKKRAQLVIARLEQAIDETGYSVGYAPASDVEALDAWLKSITEISDTTLNGTLVFNARTFAELKSRALKAGANGPLSEILTTGEMPTVWGYRFVVVPNDLMPSLGGSESVSHYVDGENVAINHAVYFAELSTFTGRTSGGLKYDVSTDAAYEIDGVVRSAYQRNELVLRGSFFRGGAVRDPEVVAGIRQGAGANVS